MWGVYHYVTVVILFNLREGFKKKRNFYHNKFVLIANFYCQVKIWCGTPISADRNFNNIKISSCEMKQSKSNVLHVMSTSFNQWQFFILISLVSGASIILGPTFNSGKSQVYLWLSIMWLYLSTKFYLIYWDTLYVACLWTKMTNS